MSIERPLGPLIVGIDGTALDQATAERLCHPAVGGVILFSRNYESPEQLRALAGEIGALRSPRLLLAVDQEGGRVQRFREGFTPLPPLGLLGRWYASHPDRARDLAYRHGRVMAAEVLGHGVDLSFAPVLDLDRGSSVIGDRSMASEPAAVGDLAAHYIAGMKDAGMRCCGKHFPGHGSVEADSHDEVVVDRRDLDDLEADLAPFAELAGSLDSVMMAHVCYPARDAEPAGYSRAWIVDTLRERLNFRGVVISDDLDMVGAGPAGSLAERVSKSLAAGCNAVLVCRPESVRELLDGASDWVTPEPGTLERLYGRAMASLDEQMLVPEFRSWRESLRALS
ncbi:MULTISPECIES: beta-N-acetylhexosaminidase [unclassified Wenzhouxiangella]|uniref:beta-N-acetylhexosaminidase n=1 Tax=unclassified Wenzhouxiangella TaxID=2613841 RepID=UPI000E32A678|nr:MULTISPECIES: beta-N-acetylhexosaminidase [unclassified Wenzhouxiangella]RFF28311.1 beta-N-acetylhexosaminidase [Wenzhouxiangella sp. 15181]RFP67764.1 beta-N-acetylhexosaminidase [Wenzhouxiangella sp. 15190]